jgi:phosphate transport system protein
MTKHLHRDLEGLERQLLYLAGQVEESLRRAMTALIERRIDLAEKVIDGDDEIDRREVQLEEDCLKVLALHQPVATDLRFIAACLKINNDLERIGDLATNIAERAVGAIARGPSDVPPRFREMMETVARMVREAIDAFVRGDAWAARRVCDEDDKVDRANRAVIDDLLEAMHADPHVIDQAMQYFSISKSLERVADHATNIAEDVVYLVEGDIIRHRGHAAK